MRNPCTCAHVRATLPARVCICVYAPMQKYFAGGAVFTATAGLHWHAPHALPLRMELGTLPFLEIISLKHGLDVSD